MGCHEPNKENMLRGAYIAIDPHHGLGDGTLIFSEEHLPLLTRTAAILSVQGIAVRLIAVRDIGLFIEQEQDYQEMLLTAIPPLFAVTDGEVWSGIAAERIPFGDAAGIANVVKAHILAD